MDNRGSSRCSSAMSGSADMSLYNNNNNEHNSLKMERASPHGDGSRNYFLRWKGYEGNLLR
jgi:hypothetical protein